MSINDLTLGQLKEISSLVGKGETESAYKVGEQYFIRTATFHCVGKLVKKTIGELELENASWIADSGRLNQALLSGNFDEIEPFPNNLIVNINGIIDATAFLHELPKVVK